MYTLLRQLLFFFPPEGVHYFSMHTLRFLFRVPLVRAAVSRHFHTPNPGLVTAFSGLSFPNPVGLAAGFDKNARFLPELEALGFGFVETGTVTPLPQAGNEKPRLFRLPADKALINRMGFNNDGVQEVATRLRNYRTQTTEKGRRPRMIVGGNIGKNKITPNELAWKDYETCFLGLADCVDYFVVNVSSPNTPGLRALQEKDALRKILVHLQQLNMRQPVPRPILLKIAPDLEQPALDDVIALAMEIKLDGLVVANTTVSREGLQTNEAITGKIGAGGLSGKPVAAKSTALLKYIIQQTGGLLPVIASGGIFTAADAREKMEKGAVLVQVWTGFIYEGPAIVKNICRGLLPLNKLPA